MPKNTPRINRTVFEIWTGIIIFGFLCEFGVFFIPSKVIYSVCLLVGILTAVLASYHMWWSIDRSLDYGVDAPKKLSMHFMIRYIFLIIVLGIMGFRFGSYVLVTFVGIMGMKAGAYLQPVTKKLSTLLYGEEILPPVIEYLYDEEKPVECENEHSSEIKNEEVR